MSLPVILLCPLRPCLPHRPLLRKSAPSSYKPHGSIADVDQGTYAIAGAFSGVLAYGLLSIRGALHPWQYLFLVEGAITIGLAIVAAIYLPWHLSTAWFLSKEEREWADIRMIRDSGGQDNASRGITRSDVIEGLKDWKFCGWPLVSS